MLPCIFVSKCFHHSLSVQVAGPTSIGLLSIVNPDSLSRYIVHCMSLALHTIETLPWRIPAKIYQRQGTVDISTTQLKLRFTSMYEIASHFFCSSPQELMFAKDDHLFASANLQAAQYPDNPSPELPIQFIYSVMCWGWQLRSMRGSIVAKLQNSCMWSTTPFCSVSLMLLRQSGCFYHPHSCHFSFSKLKLTQN